MKARGLTLDPIAELPLRAASPRWVKIPGALLRS